MQRDHNQEFSKNCKNLEVTDSKTLQNSKHEYYKKHTPTYVIIKPLKIKDQNQKT